MQEPLSRADSREQTRTRLIGAAAEVIAEKGYHAASLMEIADRAGVTTGAIYSNFRSKAGLLAAVRDSLFLTVDFETAPLESGDAAETLVRTAQWAAREAVNPEMRRVLQLQLEFVQLALRDPDIMQTMVEGIREERAKMAAVLAERTTVPPPARTPSSEQLAALITATIQGLTQHRMIDPEAISEDLFQWALEAILAAAGSGQPGQTEH